MDTFANRKNKVLSFIDKVREQEEQEEQDKAFKNSTDYKLKCLDKEQEKAKGVCLDMIFSKIYKDALPLCDDYKVAHGDDLDAEFKDFIHDRCPNGMAYYVREAIKKGSKPVKQIMDKTDEIVNDEYHDKAMNIEGYSADDMVFRMTDDTQKKIDVLNNELNLNDLSQVINDNVKNTAISEIKRAKQEKENIKNLENELTNDMKVTDEAAIDNILELKGYTESKTFEPSLFQGIMIGKLNNYINLTENAKCDISEYTYNALSDYGFNESTEDNKSASIEELAFIESVKEYTKLSILKALKLESFNKNKINDLANEYAYTVR